MRIETLQTGSEPTADLAGPAAAPQSASLEVLHFEFRTAAFVKLLNRAAWIVGLPGLPGRPGQAAPLQSFTLPRKVASGEKESLASARHF